MTRYSCTVQGLEPIRLCKLPVGKLQTLVVMMYADRCHSFGGLPWWYARCIGMLSCYIHLVHIYPGFIYMASFALGQGAVASKQAPERTSLLPSLLHPNTDRPLVLFLRISSPGLTQARQIQALVVAARTRRHRRARLEVHLPVVGIRRHLAGDKVEFCTGRGSDPSSTK